LNLNRYLGQRFLSASKPAQPADATHDNPQSDGHLRDANDDPCPRAPGLVGIVISAQSDDADED
jgi:hypothetical protein